MNPSESRQNRKHKLTFLYVHDGERVRIVFLFTITVFFWGLEKLDVVVYEASDDGIDSGTDSSKQASLIAFESLLDEIFALEVEQPF